MEEERLIYRGKEEEGDEDMEGCKGKVTLC